MNGADWLRKRMRNTGRGCLAGALWWLVLGVGTGWLLSQA